jgi:hypothetical protein
MYSLEVITAAKRVSDTFANGCDRCDLDDLDLLEANGLMTQGIVEEPSDTLEEGDTAWFFNTVGAQLVGAIQGAQ